MNLVRHLNNSTSGMLPLALAMLVSTLVGCTVIPNDPRSSGGSPRNDLGGDRQTSMDGPGLDGPGALSRVTMGESEIPRDLPKSRIGNPPTYVVFGQRYKVMDTAAGFRQTGVASWYGSKFHGRDTSSGEVYNMYNMTAAHKHLPLPTFVTVNNLDNGRSITVKVNDRGPFVGDRIIDLSYAAASKIGMLEKGTANVEIIAVSKHPEVPQMVAAAPVTPGYISQTEELPALAAALPQSASIPEPFGTVIQVGAYRSFSNAENMRLRVDRVMQAEAAIVRTDQERSLHRVQVGPLAAGAPIEEIIAQLQQAGINKVTVLQR